MITPTPAGHAARGVDGAFPALLGAALDEPAAAARLRLLTGLLDSIEAARVQAMADAAAEGWGLRRIADQCGISHEQVRRLLADVSGIGGP